jgi:hypothetical protein
MDDELRRDEPFGERLGRLEQRLSRIDERLARIESRVGIVAEERVAKLEQHALPAEKLVLPAAAAKAPERPAAGILVTRAEPAPDAKQPAVPVPRPRTVPKPRREVSFGELEQRVTGRLLAWVGGLALIIGAIFFLSLAFSRGWIGPTARVIIGLLAGMALVAAGGWFFERRDRLFGHVLTPVGLGILSLSFFAGTQLYDLFPIELGLAGALLSAVAAAVIAIRANSQLIAGYGLVTALAAPIVLSASPSATTIAYVATALIGTTVVALFRSWNWLPAIAFLLAAPQVIDYVTGDVAIAAGMAALWAFWLLNAVAAGGEEFRRSRGRLSITSTTLLVANAVFLVGWGFYLLQDEAEWGRGPFLVAVAAAHLALGGYFLVRRGDHHPFGMLAFGTGIASASLALPVQLGGPVVPIGWAAEAAALAWVYASRKHGYSGLMSMALGALAVGHLISFEYPADQINQAGSSAWPFLNANGGTLAFLLAALAVSSVFIRRLPLVVPIGAIGTLLVVYALPFETSGLLLVGAWAAIFVAAVAIDQRLLAPRLQPGNDEPFTVRSVALKTALSAGCVAGAAAVLHVMYQELPLDELGTRALPSTPFWDRGTAAALMLIAASLIAGWLARRARLQHAAIGSAFAIAAYLMPFELRTAGFVVAWSALALISLAVARFDRGAVDFYGAVSGLLVGLAALVTLYDVAPPSRLMVSGSRTIDHPLFWSAATASIGSIVIVLVAGAITFRRRQIETAAWLVAGVGFVYLLSIGLVDHFQGRVGGAMSLEELQKQAQVALSILWASLGGIAVLAGLWRQVTVVRGAGLALLGLVTAKVFLYDLSSLDAAYRVLSFIGLGVLLLISAYLYQHIGPHGHRPSTT